MKFVSGLEFAKLCDLSVICSWVEPKEIKTQSKGEYKIAEAGTNYLIELDKITKGMSDINK